MLYVIRASIGGYDELRPHQVDFEAESSLAVCYDITEAKIHRDPRRTAKQYKVIPHRMNLYVEPGDTILWMDASHSLLLEPERVSEEWLGDGYDFAHFRHNSQDCMYEEIKTCLYHQLEDPEPLLWIWNRAQHDGFPARAGLGTNTVLAMRMNGAVQELLDFWWELIEEGPVRDQCSFEYALWKHPLVRRRLIEGNVYDHPFFAFVRHQGPVPQNKALTLGGEAGEDSNEYS